MAPFAMWKVTDDEEYKLVLEGQQICELEAKLKGKNLLSVMGDAETGAPSLRIMLLITQAAMQRYHHGKKIEDIYKIYDRYVQNGGSLMDFYVDVYVPIFQCSGFFSKKQAEKIEEVTNEEA